MKYLIKEYLVPIVRACKVIGLTRSIWYYQSKRDDAQVIDKLTQLAEAYPTRGFDDHQQKGTPRINVENAPLMTSFELSLITKLMKYKHKSLGS